MRLRRDRDHCGPDRLRHWHPPRDRHSAASQRRRRSVTLVACPMHYLLRPRESRADYRAGRWPLSDGTLLLATSAHAGLVKEHGRSLLWALAERKKACKHQSGHERVDTSAAARGVAHPPTSGRADDSFCPQTVVDAGLSFVALCAACLWTCRSCWGLTSFVCDRRARSAGLVDGLTSYESLHGLRPPGIHEMPAVTRRARSPQPDGPGRSSCQRRSAHRAGEVALTLARRRALLGVRAPPPTPGDVAAQRTSHGAWGAGNRGGCRVVALGFRALVWAAGSWWASTSVRAAAWSRGGRLRHDGDCSRFGGDSELLDGERIITCGGDSPKPKRS